MKTEELRGALNDWTAYRCLECGHESKRLTAAIQVRIVNCPKCKTLDSFRPVEESEPDPFEKTDQSPIPIDLFERLWAVIPETCGATFSFKVDKDPEGSFNVKVSMLIMGADEEGEVGEASFTAPSMEGLLRRLERFFVDECRDATA